MGGSPKNTTTTQKVEPWDSAKPYYERLYSQAEEAFNATDRKPYTGELYAGPNATQQQALDLYKGAALNMIPLPAAPSYSEKAIGFDPTNKLAMDTITGMYLSPDSNPFIKSAVEASIRPVEQRLTRFVLPGLEDQSIAQGAFGGAGNGAAKGLATSDFTQQALDIASRMYDANYQRERQNQMLAPGLFGQAQGLQDQLDAATRMRWQDQVASAMMMNQQNVQQAQLLDQAGSQQQSWSQAALDADLQRYNINQAAPWTGLGEWAQILNGGGFNSAGVTTRAPGGGAGSFLQGAAGAAAIGASLFPNAFRGGAPAAPAGGGGWGTPSDWALLLGAGS